MKKILLSVGILAVVGAIVVGVTGAFFSDTETSTGNTFTAGSIDLKVDSTSHYNGMICTLDSGWQSEDEGGVSLNHYPQPGDLCDGTWTETDLGAQHIFFNYSDLKPGDEGEDTLSLHVYSNDAWGRFVMTNYVDSDNGCTEPELEAEQGCTKEGDGELDDAMDLNVWLDQGSTPGFQNGDHTGLIDPEEGDNIWQKEYEPEVNITGVGDKSGVVYDLWETFASAYEQYCVGGQEDGHNDYGVCHGLALDGRMVGSTTYYFGVEWNIPADTGNEVQSDKLESDFSFEVVQHRNNPSKIF